MNQSVKRLTLDNFQESHKKNKQQKLLQQALVYLKLRQYGCPKSRALIFAKKKQAGTDATKIRDGPAGYRKLVPEKPEGQLTNGWLKGQKLKYKNLRGFSEQIIKNVSKQKMLITSYNKIARAEFQELRTKKKQQKKLEYYPSQSKRFLQQIGVIKDQLLKDRQKRNLFLSYQGLRLEQHTKNFFDKIQQQDPNSYIVKFAAFENPLGDQNFKLQTDLEIAKGRSLNSYQIEGQEKRKNVLQFRKSLTNLSIPKKDEQQGNRKFRTTLHNSNKKIMAASLTKFPKQKSSPQYKQIEQFYNNLDKLVWMKTKRPQSELIRYSEKPQIQG